MTSIYKELSNERKNLQECGELPDWYTTAAWQLFKNKYSVPGERPGIKNRFEIIASTLSKYMPDSEAWEEKFFELMWKGWFSPSSPMLANTGTDRGCSVSCSGGYIQDSIDGFYSAAHEAALLTKHGFGTSAYLGDIRPRGSGISSGGKASGVIPVIKNLVQVTRDVAQGSVRRGAIASYLDMGHEDFWEVIEYLHKNPDDLNIGWNVYDSDIEKLKSGDVEWSNRFKRMLKVKAETGKGYFFFVDKTNRANPPMYIDNDLFVRASNLCTEVTLFSDLYNTFTCVLGSLNLAKRDEWKDTDTVFVAIVLLDCLCEDFIQKGKSIKGLEKAVRFTQDSRALGLGTMGFHTYLQDKGIAFEDFEAHLLNTEIFKDIKDKSEQATQWLAVKLGEPFLCKGYGARNTHLLAIAPNMSSAILMGGVSQGVEPMVANVFNQGSAAGEIERINPSFLRLMKEKGKYTPSNINSIIDNKGSVQHFDWLTDGEKLVYKTAFEIDQKALLRLASVRQRYICQAQSLNLFFDADEDEGYIAEIHREAFIDPYIKSLYYMRTLAGVQASKDECVACQA